MKPNQPPKVPRWLLEHFGCTSNNQAVIGDLDERYYRGRTHSWYWRQSLLAIVSGLFHEVWTHNLLTLRAILVGWTLFVISRVVFGATRNLLITLGIWSRLWRPDWIGVAIVQTEILLSALAIGWVIAKLHPSNRSAMVLAYAVYFASIQIFRLVTGLLAGGMVFSSFVYFVVFILISAAGILFGGLFLHRYRGRNEESATV